MKHILTWREEACVLSAMTPHDLISLEDAMHILGVSRTKIWCLTKEGLLKTYVNNLDRRQKLFSKAEVESILPQRAKVA